MSAVIRPEQILPVGIAGISKPVRWGIGLAGLLLLVLGILFVTRIAADPSRFPVLNVDVDGTLDYTDRQQLKDKVETFTKQGFYGMDVDAIRESVEALPWVANVHVRRMWPARLLVNVSEHEPAARYNDDALVSKTLEVFKPPQLQKDNPQYAQWQNSFSSLPRLAGAAGRHEDMLDAFRRYQTELAVYGVSIDALLEDERRSQTLELSNSVTVRLGYEAHELRLQRFLDVYERLVTPLNGQPARFDMRYSNGFALSGADAIRGKL